MKLSVAQMLVEEEYYKANHKFPPFNTNHEGHSVIEEEFDELWDEIKAIDPSEWSEKMQTEAVQLAAMALRFLTDRC
jgi:hypothetical protein